MAVILAGVTYATVISVPLDTFIARLASWRAASAATGALVAIALLTQVWFVPSLPSDKTTRVGDLTWLLRDGHFAMAGITWLPLAFGEIGFVSIGVASVAKKRSLPWTTAWIVSAADVLLLPILRHSQAGVIVRVRAWGLAFGAIPLRGRLGSQRVAPQMPEAGLARLGSAVQVASALGSSMSGMIDEHAGILPDVAPGGMLALLASLAQASISRAVKTASGLATLTN